MAPEFVRYNEAVERAKQDDTQGAVKIYEEVLAERPTFIQARQNLGALYYEMGKYDFAEHQFRLLLEVVPGYPLGMENLAVTLLALGGREREEEAMKLLRKALTVENRPEWQQQVAEFIAKPEPPSPQSGEAPPAESTGLKSLREAGTGKR